MARTVVAIYDDFQTANTAVRELVDMGFSRENISIVANNASGQYDTTSGTTTTTRSVAGDTGAGAGVGAGIGAAVGGIGGLLVGLGALVIPGIGPVIAAGPLAVALSTLTGAGVGAVAGGVTGGLLGALIGLGIPEEEAEYYAEGIRRGGVLVTVMAGDDNFNQVMDVLNRHDPIDLNSRVAQWREQGWSRFNVEDDANTGHVRDTITGTAGSAVTGQNYPPAQIDVPETSDTTSGSNVVDSNARGSDDDEVESRYDLGASRSDIASRGMTSEGTGAGAMGTLDTDMPDAGIRETGMDSPEVSETIMSDTGAQETGMGDTSMRTTDMDDSYGSESTAWTAGSQSMRDDFDANNAVYMNHYNAHLANTGYPFEYYAPAYRYGYGLTSDSRFQNATWDVIEPDVRTDWETEHPGTWERFKAAIREAWEDISGQDRPQDNY